MSSSLVSGPGAPSGPLSHSRLDLYAVLSGSKLENAGTLTCFAVFLVLFGTHGDMMARNAGWLPLRPTVAYAVFSLVFCSYLVFRELRGDPSPLLETFRQNTLLILPLVFLAGLNLIWSIFPTAYWGNDGAFVIYPAYNVFVLGTAMAFPLLRVVRRHFTSLALLVLCTLLATTLADVLDPGLFSKHPGRPAGLPENANVSAFLMIAAASVLVDGKRSRGFNISVLVATGAGVLLTVSRGGMILFLLMLLAHGSYSLLTDKRPLRTYLPTLAIGAACLVLAVGVTASIISSDVGAFSYGGVQKRIAHLKSGELVSSDDARIVLARDYIGRILEAPILGHGAAFTHSLPKGPHNQFLLEWVDLGALGLGSYVAFLASGLALFFRRRSRNGVTLMVVVIGFSFLSHTLLESRGLLLFLGMIAASSAPVGQRQELPDSSKRQDAA